MSDKNNKPEYDPMEETIAVCSECHSDNPEYYVEKNSFYQAGAYHVPCMHCKGRLLFVARKNRNAALKAENASRGLSGPYDPNRNRNVN